MEVRFIFNNYHKLIIKGEAKICLSFFYALKMLFIDINIYFYCMLSGELLIDSINRKQVNGWNLIYEKFYTTLCRFALKIVKSPIVAEDIVQECYIGLWNSSLTFSSIEALGGYLYRSVYTRSLNQIRNQSNLFAIETKWREQLSQWENEDYAIEMAIHEELVSRLHHILGQLPEQQKDVILFAIKGLKVKEIAVHMGITENSVKTHKKRAYSYIKAHLALEDYVLFSLFYKKQ